MRWGLVGHNSDGPDPKRSTFNARAETLERARYGEFPSADASLQSQGSTNGCDLKVVPVIVRRGHATGPAVPSAVP